MTTTKRKIALLLLIPFMGVGAQRTDVVLVQGLDEQADFLNYWSAVLSGTGNYTPHLVGAINSSTSIPTQSDALTSYLTGSAFATSPILVGHSQGGLVSRFASRSVPVAGLLTVASPNAGAPIAGPGAFGAIAGAQALLGIELFDMNQALSLNWGECDCSQAWYDANTFITDAITLIGTGFELLKGVPFLFTNPYLGDNAPGSSEVTSLLTNSSLEQAARREAIGVDVIDYSAAPWRLLFDQGTADVYAGAIALWGLNLTLDAMSIQFAAEDPNSCWSDNCAAFENAANAMGIIAQIFEDVPYIANVQVIGGVPNDALVPTFNEALPDKPLFRTVGGITHMEVLGDGDDIIGALNFMTNR
jgi:hypothetical protein